jgi:hypothetical protein
MLDYDYNTTEISPYPSLGLPLIRVSASKPDRQTTVIHITLSPTPYISDRFTLTYIFRL